MYLYDLVYLFYLNIIQFLLSVNLSFLFYIHQHIPLGLCYFLVRVYIITVADSNSNGIVIAGAIFQ